MSKATLTRHFAATAALVLAGFGSSRAQAETAADSALHFETLYTGDVFSNRRGGLERGERYLDNVDVSLAIDGEKLWDIPGLTLFVYGLYNSGGGFSEKYVGDSFTASNIDAPAATRLYEAWVDWKFGAEDGHSVRAGLYDLNSDFDSSEPRGLFINSSFGVGQDLAQTGDNGPSIFPAASLGVRFDLQLAPQWRLLSAAFDGVPGDANDPTATTIRLNESDGLLLITELQYLPSGPLEKLAAGVWGYTKEIDYIVAEDVSPAGTAHNRGWYVSADSRFGSYDEAEEQSWSTSLRIGRAEKRVNNHEWFVATALTYDLPRPEGREHSFGIGASWARTSSAFRTAADDIDAYEAALELTWRATLTDWLTVQPDVQYIVNTGSQRALQNALVLGLRFEVTPPSLRW